MSNRKGNERWNIDIVELESILDRTINFVGNCDNKAAIILGIYGVIIAILFSEGGIFSFKCIIKSSLSENNYLYLLLLGFSLIVVGLGFVLLLLVLTARINCKKYQDNVTTSESSIFWGDIVVHKNFKDYRKKMSRLTEDNYRNDIMTQIYFNSQICKKKFDYYNKGLWISAIGFICLIIVWGIGTLLF